MGKTKWRNEGGLQIDLAYIFKFTSLRVCLFGLDQQIELGRNSKGTLEIENAKELTLV